jgi:hypothetical protein
VLVIVPVLADLDWLILHREDGGLDLAEGAGDAVEAADLAGTGLFPITRGGEKIDIPD